jgi:hypothetical protein
LLPELPELAKGNAVNSQGTLMGFIRLDHGSFSVRLRRNKTCFFDGPLCVAKPVASLDSLVPKRFGRRFRSLALLQSAVKEILLCLKLGERWPRIHSGPAGRFHAIAIVLLG